MYGGVGEDVVELLVESCQQLRVHDVIPSQPDLVDSNHSARNPGTSWIDLFRIHHSDQESSSSEMVTLIVAVSLALQDVVFVVFAMLEPRSIRVSAIWLLIAKAHRSYLR